MLNQLNLILYLTAALLGACIASFINVLIYRLPRGMQFIKGNSVCPGCGKQIKAYDLVPVISYIILGGKCRNCKAPISLKYPLVEALGGVLAVLAVWRFGFGWAAAVAYMVWIFLVAVVFIDAEHMIIPDGLSISIGVLALVWAALHWSGFGWVNIGLLNRTAGFFIISLPMFILTLIIDGAFGGGDIKLIAVCGFLLGFKLTVLAAFTAVVLGGICAVYIKFAKKDKNKLHMAFGPFLAAGIFAAMMYGNEIIDRYLSLWYY